MPKLDRVISCMTFLPALWAQSQHSATVELEFTPQVSASYWVHGFLPKFSRSMNGEEAAVWMFDRDGKQVIPRTRIAFPDAPQADIHAATADVHGNLYASVEAWARNGMGTGAICRLAAGDGAGPIQIIRTDDFLPIALAGTDSGEIWAFGLPLELQAARSTEREYMTLWRFNSDGRVIQKLLPRSSFGPGVIPTHVQAGGWPQIWATGTHVGIYSANSARWIELDSSSGKIVVDLRVPRPMASDGAAGNLSFIAMTDPSNEVYGQWGFSTDAHTRGLFKLDKTVPRWVALDEPQCPAGCPGLRGAEGSALILRAPGGTSHSWTFDWIEPAALTHANR